MKRFAKKLAPHFYARLATWRYHKRDALIARRLFSAFEGRVASGPFAGMQYIQTSVGSTICPKLLGCYEGELHSTILSLQSNYESAVDIGCAEGYYAVGFARRFPTTTIYAFDIAPTARVLCDELSSINAVQSRVRIGAECTPDILASIAAGRRSLVIADCEGFERDLFQSRCLGALTQSDIIIETHDLIRPGTSDYLLKLLEPSHIPTVIGVTPRKPDEIPYLKSIPEEFRNQAVVEGRDHRQTWLFFRPRE